jgi:hypothetical protein
MNELYNEEEVLLILRRRILLNSHVNVGVTHLLTGHLSGGRAKPYNHVSPTVFDGQKLEFDARGISSPSSVGARASTSRRRRGTSSSPRGGLCARGGDSRDEKFAATGRRFEWTDAKASVKARRAGDDTSARAVGVDLVSRRVVAVAGDVVADEETNRGAPEREDEGVGTARHP